MLQHDWTPWDKPVEIQTDIKIKTLPKNQEEAWWLIERKTETFNQFFDGEKWTDWAFEAARFKTKECAQSVIDHYILGETVLGSVNTMREYAFPVEHIWLDLLARTQEAGRG